MPSQEKVESAKPTASTTNNSEKITAMCVTGLASSGWLIGLLIAAAYFYWPAGRVLERLLVP